MASACAAITEMPEAWDELLADQVQALLAVLTPPDELQEYHATLTELLTFAAQNPPSDNPYADVYTEEEILNRLAAHVVAAQGLSPDLRAVIEQECPRGYVETLDSEEFFASLKETLVTERLTRDEYLDACQNFLGILAFQEIEGEEELPVATLEAIVMSSLDEAGLVFPPAELVEYHELVVGWLALVLESLKVGQLQEENPDDRDARATAAALYLAFKDLGLALGPTLRLMDPSLKEVLAERGCLIEE